MPNCKRCNNPTVWNKKHHEETGKWVPFDPKTSEPHDCPEYNPQGNGNRNTVTVQQKPQLQLGPGQSRYETSYLIPKEDWERLAAQIAGISIDLEKLPEIAHRLEQLSEYYNGIYEHLKNQHRAEAEALFDQDKEDGLV